MASIASGSGRLEALSPQAQTASMQVTSTCHRVEAVRMWERKRITARRYQIRRARRSTTRGKIRARPGTNGQGGMAAPPGAQDPDPRAATVVVDFYVLKKGRVGTGCRISGALTLAGDSIGPFTEALESAATLV